MSASHFFFPALFVAASILSSAQTSPEGSPPETNVQGSHTPSLLPDGRVNFSLKAPDAKTLAVNGGQGLGKGPFPMTKGADGTWTVTIPAPVPGFHYYWLELDGVRVNDPGSKTYFGYGREMSGIEIPEAGVDYYDIQRVPHGEVREHWYFSKTTGEWRRCFVYTPPQYGRSTSDRYPVLYLQHGAGEDETGWTRQGKANFILDNLIAQHKAKPMIIVMDHGYATRAGQKPVNFGPGSSPERMRDAFAAFQDVVLHDLIPDIDSTYRTIADRDHRAMAGLSMGAMQTLEITLHHPEYFAYVGSFSGPLRAGLNLPQSGFDPKTAFDGVFANAQEFNSKYKLLWFGVGTEEKQFISGVDSAVDALRKAGIHVVYFESPGTAHEWQTWRRDLHDFAPRLFQ